MSRYVDGNLALQETYEQEERARNQKPKKRRNPRRLNERALYVLMMVVFVLVSCIVISRYAAVYELSLRTKQLETAVEKLKLENNDLKLKVAKMSDPQRISKEAALIGLKPVDEKDMKRLGVEADSEQSDSVASR